MSENTIRIGVIGAGNNTRKKHIPGLQAIEGVEVTGVCNRSRDSSQRVADQFNISRVYSHWREVTDDPDLDAVVIGTWPYLHCPATLAALQGDKHVMCEARMAMDAQQAHAMNDAAAMNPHLIAQVVPSPMTLAVDGMIRQLIADGYLGRLLALEIRQHGKAMDREAPFNWRQDRDMSGMNIMAMGIWYEALARWVGQVTRVQAMGKTFVKTRPDDQGMMRAVHIPDHVDVLGDLACGAQLHMQLSAVTAWAEQNGLWLAGSEASLHLPMPANQLWGRKVGEKDYHQFEIPSSLQAQWRVEAEFINAIRGQERIQLTDFPTAVQYMEFTQAVTRSLQTGQSIALPL